MKKSPEKSDLKKELASVRKEFEAMKSSLLKLTYAFNKTVIDFKKSIDEQKDFFKEIMYTNGNIEDTLLNVLVAIRQNEYLQAWYPEQQGFSAMKVTGTHPAKLQRK